jgi:two-component system alkaline phosphatase synthesis response regulator PhoP
MPAKILVVDDEQSILDLVAAYLRPEGYTVETAVNGRLALQTMRTFQPNLVVLDIMLPGMDGLERLTQLRREALLGELSRKDVYVILLTAKNEETDKLVGLAVGADDYLTKPFSPRELVARGRPASSAKRQQFAR